MEYEEFKFFGRQGVIQMSIVIDELGEQSYTESMVCVHVHAL